MAKSASVKRKRAPRRDVIEMLPLTPRNPLTDRPFRLWINGVEATSVRSVQSEFEPTALSFSKIADPITPNKALFLKVEFASPRVSRLTTPITKRKPAARPKRKVKP